MRARGKASAARTARQPEPVQRSSTRLTLTRIADRQDAVGQHVADEGARDQRAAVDVEAHAVHVGRAHQIGRGQAQAHAGVDQGEQPRALGRGRPEVEIGIEPVDRQPQRLPAPGTPPRRGRWSCRGHRPAARRGSGAPRTGRFHPGCRERVCWRRACRPRLPDMNRRAFLFAGLLAADCRPAGARRAPAPRGRLCRRPGLPALHAVEEHAEGALARLAGVQAGDLDRGRSRPSCGRPTRSATGRAISGRSSTSCRARAARRAS